LNSVGVDAFIRNLSGRKTRTIVGVNIGKNKDTPNENAADDYALCFEKLYPHVDYITLNVSSPNTVGLRDLQSAEALAALLSGMKNLQVKLRETHGRNVAVALKIAPDLDHAAIRDIAEAAKRARIDGIVATNTTTDRKGVAGYPQAQEQGGLSGAPL